MKPELFLGLDTSAYTTSLAVVDRSDELLFDGRRVLDVESGQRGLRQSEALYQHIRNLPELFREASPVLETGELKAVGVSEKPEGREESFMPVFLAGISSAEAAASVTGAPLYRFTHQEGHLMAAEWSSGKTLPENYLGVHFSGGTSEILEIHRKDPGFTADLLAGSLDLKAGQLIDRIGVTLGLPFPAGASLDRLVRENPEIEALPIPASMDGADFHFSGQENYIRSRLEEGAEPAALAKGLFRMIARTLERSLRTLRETTGLRTVLFSGGVMANSLIREELMRRLAPSGMQLIFSDPAYSSDQAVGCALLTRRRYLCQTES